MKPTPRRVPVLVLPLVKAASLEGSGSRSSKNSEFRPSVEWRHPVQLRQGDFRHNQPSTFWQWLHGFMLKSPLRGNWAREDHLALVQRHPEPHRGWRRQGMASATDSGWLASEPQPGAWLAACDLSLRLSEQVSDGAGVNYNGLGSP